MDSLSQREEHESCAKRLKLDLNEPKNSVLCNGGGFGEFSPFKTNHINGLEGVSPDCDSGYDASTMESASTPINIVSPNMDNCETTADTHDSLSEIVDPELEDDNISTVSNLSDLSCLSDLSGQDWKPLASGSVLWVQKQMSNGIDPRSLLTTIVGSEASKIPDHMDDITLWKIILNMMSEPPRRHKLRHVNTLDDVIRLLKGAKNIIVLTGAGVSVSCGIPDFRSRDGIYSRLAVDFPDLPDPQAMFDIQYFSQDPRPFFKFAKDIYPGQFKPSPCHRFIKLLEKHNKLLRNYTQNIDTLENIAGIQNVIECHGSFASATCTKCSHKCSADEIKGAVTEQRIPMCPKCLEERGETDSSDLNYKDLVSLGIMKPDIVFFGEGLPDHFHEAMAADKNRCDLLIVIGSSLKVRPVALIPSSLPADIPQILINREPLPHCHFDVELMGDCDTIINQLCHMMGNPWTEGCCSDPLNETTQLLPEESTLPKAPVPSCDILDTTSTSQVSEHTTKDENTTTTTTSTTSTTNKVECQLLENNIENANHNCHDVQNEYFLCSNDEHININLNINDNVNIECMENHFNSVSSSDISSNFTSTDLKTTIKERHISIDSARDSGIGDSCNLTDSCSSNTKNENDIDCYDSSHVGMANFWEPKLKRSLAARLPDSTYYLVPPNRYIFPGAEVFYDPDENYTFSDDESSDSDSSDNDSSSDNDNDNEETKVEIQSFHTNKDESSVSNE